MPLERLIDVLEQLDQKHLILLDLVRSKKDAIINNDIDTIILCMNKESKLIKKIEALDETRVLISYQVLQQRGIKSQLNLNVTELSRLVFDPEEKRKLLSVQSHLSHTLTQLKEVNEINQKLIEQSLSFIDYSIDILVGRPNQEATYQHPTDKNGVSSQPGIFDTRA
ncbi:FlgN protein [compost metagenome]